MYTSGQSTSDPPIVTDDTSLDDYGDVTSRLQVIVEAASEQLARPVAIDDRHHRLLVYSQHAEEEVDPIRLASILRQPASSELLEWLWRHGVRTASGAIRVPANDQLGLDARVCVPIRCHTHLLGFFWLTDRDQSLGQAELRQAEEAAEQAGVVLYREIMLRDLERGREREFIRDILSEDQNVRAEAVAHLPEFDLFVSQGPLVAIVVRMLGRHEELAPEALRLSLDAALMRVRRWLAPKHGVHLLRTDHAVMLVSLADPTVRARGRMAFAQRIADEFMHNMSEHGAIRCVVAVGGVARDLLHASDSHRQAIRAAEVATTVSSFGDVVDWEQLGVYRMLAELPIERLGPEAVNPALRDLMDNPRARSLIRTVECYLDNAGDAQATALELFLHRTTLYHRLRRFEESAGVDLSNGGDRLILHLSLKLARLQGRSWTDDQPDQPPIDPS